MSTTLEITVGSHEDYPLQCWNRGAKSAPVFLPSDVMTAYLYVGLAQAQLLTLAVTWYTKGGTQTGYDQGQVLLTITSAQSAPLIADATYTIIIWRTPSGSLETSDVWRGELLTRSGILAANVPPDLATAAYVTNALSQINLAPGELNFLPSVITQASNLFRAYCHRQFNQGTYTEIVPVRENGTIRLRETPTNYLTRVQCAPQVALSITNGSADSAWVAVAATGDVTTTTGLTVTGLVLNSVLSGVLTATPITFSANETIGSLATAIAGVGLGWGASAPSYGAWGVTELFDLYGSKGASPNDQPYGSADYRVFAQNVTNAAPLADNGQKTGFWSVGRQYAGVGPRWGPDWQQWSNSGSQDVNPGIVRVTYNGGYTTIPAAIQLAVAELAKANFERLKTDAWLRSESAGQYRYDLATELISNLPPAVRATANLYVVHNA
jgi:hypothetical protein